MTYQIKYKIYLSSPWEMPRIVIKYREFNKRFWRTLIKDSVHTYGFVRHLGSWQYEDFRVTYFDNVEMNLIALADLIESNFDGKVEKYVKAAALYEIMNLPNNKANNTEPIELALLTKGWQYSSIEIKEDVQNGEQTD